MLNNKNDILVILIVTLLK